MEFSLHFRCICDVGLEAFLTAPSCFPDAFTSSTLGSPGHRTSASTNGGRITICGGGVIVLVVVVVMALVVTTGFCVGTIFSISSYNSKRLLATIF